MSASPRSFRLSPEAQKNLTGIAEDYGLSENKVINLLLTEPYNDTQLTNAERIIKTYLVKKLNSRAPHDTGSQ